MNHLQTLSVRVYNVPQKTGKTYEYRLRAVMYAVAKKWLGNNGTPERKLSLGFDDKRGEFVELKAKKYIVVPKPDLILWLDYLADNTKPKKKRRSRPLLHDYDEKPA